MRFHYHLPPLLTDAQTLLPLELGELKHRRVTQHIWEYSNVNLAASHEHQLKGMICTRGHD